MKLSLYNIEQEYLSLIEKVIENEGELDFETEQALALNQHNLEVKGTNYGLVIKQLESECDIIDNEISRLTALKRSRGKIVDKLKENVSTAMQIYGITEIKSPILKISFRKSESVEVENVDLLDERFKVTKTTVQADKTKIKEAIKAGETIQGAVIKINQNIQIK
jgi:hypothetical protein